MLGRIKGELTGKDRDPRVMATARQAGQCPPQHIVQSHLAWRWGAEWGWNSPGVARHTGSHTAGLRSSQSGNTGRAQGWAQHAHRELGQGPRGGVNAAPDSWAEGAQMEGNSDACPSSFSQPSCFSDRSKEAHLHHIRADPVHRQPNSWDEEGRSCRRRTCRKTLQDNCNLLMCSGLWWFIHIIC